MFSPPPLTRTRAQLAIVFAVIADGLQMAVGPLGWFGAVQVIDVVAMVLTITTLGFHVLLLPTFLIEFFPMLTMAPTWTGCVLAVIALRKRGESADPSVPPPPLEPRVPPRIEDTRPQEKNPQSTVHSPQSTVGPQNVSPTED